MKGKQIKATLLIAVFIISTLAIIPISYATHTSTATVAFTSGASNIAGQASNLDVVVTNNGPDPISEVVIDFSGTDITLVDGGTPPGIWAIASLIGEVVTYDTGTIASGASVTFVPEVTNPVSVGLATNPLVETSDATALVAATLTTGTSGTNEIDYVADTPGVAGNGISIEYTEAVSDSGLSVSVNVLAISVELADTGGTITSTAPLVVAAINADASALALVDASTTEVGLMVAMAATALSGGSEPTTGYSTTVTGTLTVITGFEATVSPLFVKGLESYWFEVSVKNNASSLALNVVTITYPALWTINNIEGPQGWVITAADEYTATGGWELNLGESAVFKFNMITGASDGIFNVRVKNVIAMEDYPPQDCKVTVDGDPPDIILVHPVGTEQTAGYSVGAGNKIWINTTVEDDFEFTPVMYINVSGFDYTIKPVVIVPPTYSWDVCFYSVSVPDGPLVFYINATDGAGNVGTSGDITVEIDNTPPEIIDIVVYDNLGVALPEPTLGKFYMSKDETAIWVNVTVYEPHLDGTNSKLYFNTTLKYAITTGTNKTKQGPYPMTGINYLVINATTFDTSSPEASSYNMTVEVFRDTVGPSMVGFTGVEPIGGGLIIRGLYGDDTVGVFDYVFYVDDIYYTTLTDVDLTSTEWTANSFNGITVMYLPTYAGEIVNITVIAEDFGLNPSDEVIVYEGLIPEGTWCPIELYEGWNLISLPLIPESSDRADVLSLILDQGESGVIVTYGYDQYSDAWITNPADITDGNGYWIYAMDYDVMIVEGTETPLPPAPPSTYSLTEGWVIGGFKSIIPIETDAYLASLEVASFFPYVYIWDASDQSWLMLEVSPATSLWPGDGFWIWMYEDQVLIPPM